MKDIKISVVIPVYNVEQYLHECVDSVLCQTYKNIEIILVDDGSPDNCPILCDELAKKHERVKVVHKTNGGLSDARNAGMKVVTGQYFMFLDSDDYWIDETFIECIVKEKLQEEKDVIIFGYTKDKNLLKKYKRNKEFEKTFENLSKAEYLELMLRHNKLQSTSCNKIVNSKFIKEYDMNFVKGRVAEDIDWVARLLLNAEKFDFFDKYVYFYRENEESITHNITKKNVMDLKYNIEKIVGWSENIKTEDYYDSYMNYCAYQYITFFYGICRVDKKEISEEIETMKKYAYLLKYNINKKVRMLSFIYNVFGFNGILRLLNIFFKLKG